MRISRNYLERKEIEALRVDTLDNNILWLSSFGCKIRIYDDLIYIDHPELPEYVARLILSTPEEAMHRLRKIFAEIKEMPTKPDIYFDELSISPGLQSALTENGFKAAYINATMSKVMRPKPESTELILKQARFHDLEKWSCLYSKGFERSEREAEIDRSRWHRTFKEIPSVRQWFLMKGNNAVGVCQTCEANNVVGIYSFALSPPERNLRNLLGAMRAIRAKVSRGGPVRTYFEVREREDSPSKRHTTKSLLGFSLIRKMTGYHYTE